MQGKGQKSVLETRMMMLGTENHDYASSLSLMAKMMPFDWVTSVFLYGPDYWLPRHREGARQLGIIIDWE